MTTEQTGSSDSSLTVRKGNPFTGIIKVPGDKSISHRALMFSALATGLSRVEGLLEGEDVLRTADAMRAMGARIERGDDGVWQIWGVGPAGLSEPEDVLDMGNSGTSARLLIGLIAGQGLSAFMTGDQSLRKRPMARVTGPLSDRGAEFVTRDGGRLPLSIKGVDDSPPFDLTTAHASAQVKSALLLFALNQPGRSTVRERVHTRDHTERMLSAMGAELTSEPFEDTGRTITIFGQPDLKPIDIAVPGDVSSAAFFLVAAALTPGSYLTIEGVGINPLRDGIVRALQAMGADLTVLNAREVSGEPVGDLVIKGGPLKALPEGVPFDPSIMIDEFPVLFVAASLAEGTSRFTGLKELRVKESDRLAMMATGLKAAGVTLTEFEDGLEIIGSGGAALTGGNAVDTAHDHRIAMSFAILSLMCATPITVKDASPIATSFPGFKELLDDARKQTDG